MSEVVLELCQGCKKEFQELEQVEIKRSVDKKRIWALTRKMASEIDGNLDGLVDMLSEEEQEQIFKGISDVLWDNLLKELFY